MASKTDRILGYLPPTFKGIPRPTALYAVVDAVGQQLLQAENSLGAVMLSHWVDHADTGAEFITDLNCFAALYGLAPRGAAKDVARFDFVTCAPVSADETIEEFREHLKRYVRTFIEGTVTVQGILRIVAEALGIHIADRYQDMDTWWTAGNDPLVLTEPRTDDAGPILIGIPLVERWGTSATPAEVTGGMHIHEADLSHGSVLRLRVDDSPPIDIQLAAHTFRASLPDVATAINRRFGLPVAAEVNGRLRLASATVGRGSRLEILDVPDDAAPALLELPPRTAWGHGPSGAVVQGVVDLPGPIDVTHQRYLRIRVDNTHIAEVDCAGEPAGQRTLSEIVDVINNAFGFPVASAHKNRLRLASPTTGPGSAISVENPAAQDAAMLLLGVARPQSVGRGPVRAVLSARRALPHTLDLSGSFNLSVSVDGHPHVTIDCRGIDPAKTQDFEIISAINRALGGPLAAREEGVLTLSSPTAGRGSQVRLLEVENDAATELFDIPARTFRGLPATHARIIGSIDLSHGADLRSQHLLQVGIDDRQPLNVDFWELGSNLQHVTLTEIVAAVNSQLGLSVASHDGQHLILTSPTAGGRSKVAIAPIVETTVRRFVTRAYITDEAAPAVLGFLRAKATGVDASPARLEGETDLSRGVDLRKKRFLRITTDGSRSKDFDFAAAIPIARGSTLDEIVSVVNAGFGAQIATHDGRHLILTSRKKGSGSSIEVSDPNGHDAFPVLFGADPDFLSASDGERVIFTGTVDLSAGVNLRKADRIKLGVNGAPPVEVHCAGPRPRSTTLDQVVERINAAVGAVVASHDGRHLIVAPPAGRNSSLDFATPDAGDATAVLLGFNPPRGYRGARPTPARVIGSADLRKSADLSTRRFLEIGVDDLPTTVVDCAAEAKDLSKVHPGEIVQAINHALGGNFARLQGPHLVVQSLRSGVHGTVRIHPHQVGYAGDVLLGPHAATIANGADAAPAVIEGKISLATPVDLGNGHVLRLAVDGAPPVDIDVGGASPNRTALSEIVAAINTVLPGVASSASSSHLLLSSPISGESSSIELLPRRALELIDYPPIEIDEPVPEIQHAGRFTVDNDGVDDSELAFHVTAPQGESGIQIVNRDTRSRIRVLDVLRPGDSLQVQRNGSGILRAAVTAADGSTRAVPDSAILVGPLGSEAFVPFSDDWLLTRGAGANARAQLNLNDAGSPATVLLRTLDDIDSTALVSVRVAKAKVPGPNRFDVTLRLLSTGTQPVIERYPAVTIGRGPSSDSLAVRIALRPSRLVLAEELDKTDILKLRRERSEFTYMNAHEARFDRVHFPFEPLGKDHVAEADDARFAGGTCREWAVFDLSRFSNAPPEQEATWFGPPSPSADPAAQVGVRWTRFQPGAFSVNLPADLDDRFGARFDEGRFGLSTGAPEIYEGVITEPASDPDFLVKRINAGSTLISARPFPQPAPPAGFEIMTMPFMHPRSRFLSGGSDGEFARMYIAEDGVPGLFELRARAKGAWGNTIAVTAKRAGTVRFDLTIGYEGVRFEGARQIALAGETFRPGQDPLAQLTSEILKPSPVGILQAKAAGVRAEVTRNRTEQPPRSNAGPLEHQVHTLQRRNRNA